MPPRRCDACGFKAGRAATQNQNTLLHQRLRYALFILCAHPWVLCALDVHIEYQTADAADITSYALPYLVCSSLERFPRPVRVSRQRASGCDKVRITTRKNSFCDRRMVDSPHCNHRYPYLSLDNPRIFSKISRIKVHRLNHLGHGVGRFIRPRANMQGGNAFGLEQPGECNDICRGEAAILELGRAQAIRHRKVTPYPFSGRSHDLQSEPRTFQK